MIMFRKLRFLSVLLVFALLAGQFGTVNVNAASGVETAPVGTKLSGFRITDLDKPVAGRDLDFKARVRTNENVTWEIPVIWTDENGNTAYTAAYGHTYYPNFAFFIPKGYDIDPKALTGQLLVKLPDFLIEMYGQTSVLFATDASLGVTYITFEQSVTAQIAKKAREEAAIAPAPAPAPNKGSESKDEGGTVDPPAPAPEPVDPVSRTVRIHCSNDIIDKYSNCPEVLEELVTLVKNKLQPQAVALLKDAFEAYDSAASDELSNYLGLWIYNNGTEGIEGETPPPEALAYVSGRYFEDIYKFAMAIDTQSFMNEDEDGNWHFIENEKVNLSNTIVHEMMHAFMDDYTRFGMADTDDRFPSWFIEGLAVTVENPYQFRSYGLQTLSTADPDDWDSDLDRFVDEVSYSASSVKSRYMWMAGEDDDRNYELIQSDSDNNGYSAYVSGYLAVVYLGYLTAVHSDVCEISENNINIPMIRSGVSQILSWIHEGYSLDSIIRYISTPTTSDDSGTARFDSTQDFESRFIMGTGTDEGSEAGIVFCNNDGTREVLGSSAFTAVYLNFLEKTCSQHGDGFDNTKLANGSLLCNRIDDQHKQEFINWDTTVESSLYKMTDDPGAGGYVTSTASDEKAFDQTGGRTIDHVDNDTGDNNIVEFPTEASVAASVASPEVTGSSEPALEDANEPANEPASEPATEPIAESVAEPAAEPAAEPVAEPVAVSDTPEEAVPPVAGIEPLPGITDTQLVADGVDLTILPHEEDAILPDNEMMVAEPAPVAEPSGDGGNDGGGDACPPESEPESAPADDGGAEEG